MLKGAVVRVIGPARFAPAGPGALRVLAGSTPSQQEVSKVEAAANRKIAEDAEVLEFEMERQEAEGHFGPGIFDLIPAPSGGERLRMVRIPEWEVSFCPKRHVESTGSIGAIRIDGAASVAGRGVEFVFHLL